MGYKVVYEFDPWKETNTDAPGGKDRRKDVLEEIAEYVRDEILQYVGEGNSPVSGRGRFSALSKDYRKFKKTVSSSSLPNMELYGDMLDDLEYKVVGNKIRIGWFGGEQAAKADGHNNFSGESTLPVRRSIPNAKDGETFKKDILRGIKDIANEALEED